MKQIKVDQIYYLMLVSLAKKMRKSPEDALQEILQVEYNRKK